MTETLTNVFVHIVTYNSAKFIKLCLESIVSQEGVATRIVVTDNASTDNTSEEIHESVELVQNKFNLGFAAAHNQGAKMFLDSGMRWMLIVNPDLVLEKNALSQMIKNAEELRTKDGRIGSVTPKLLRADDTLQPVKPNSIDAAGMYLTNNLRHFESWL